MRGRDGLVPEFRCPFHGLTWTLKGDLRDLPSEWDVEHPDNTKMCLPQAKVGTWGGDVERGGLPIASSAESAGEAPLPAYAGRVLGPLWLAQECGT